MSSGNLTADRRFAYAQDLRKDGQFTAAADLIAQALELVPDWAEGWFTLGEARAQAAESDGAVAAFRRYLALDPADSMGAAMNLSLLGAATTPKGMTPAFIRRLFDNYAERFEDSLVKALHYSAPQALRAALEAHAPGRTFARVLDLGCGTGLAGAAFRSLAHRLDGVDLSPRMVAEANAKGVYDSTAVADIVAHLGGFKGAFDLITAADVLVYFGDLDDVFAAVRAALTPDGLFVFTVQRHEGAAFSLGEERRFSHSRGYIGELAAKSALSLVALTDGVFRRDKGVDVPGLLVVATASNSERSTTNS
jgi:predicted TPR repeat methyltransferase